MVAVAWPSPEPATTVTVAVREPSVVFSDKAVNVILFSALLTENHVEPSPSMVTVYELLFVVTVDSAVAPASLVSPTWVGVTVSVAGSSGNL